MTDTLRPEPTRLYRWLVLIFVSLAMFGSYYVYDAVSPMADVLKQQLGFTDTNLGFLQAVYSIPPIFTTLLGGILIDRIGLRKSLMIFGVLCFIGPAITVSAGKLAVIAAIARWFKGRQLSFALGLNLTASRLGTFAALNSPTWAKWAFASWRTPFLIALGFAALSLVGAM